MRKVLWVEGLYYKKKPERGDGDGVRRIIKIERVDGKLSNQCRVTYLDWWGKHECSLGTFRASFAPIKLKSLQKSEPN